VLGTHYRYKILSRNLRGIFSSDSGVAAITPVSVPMPPRALSATLSDDSLVLQWEKGRNGVLYNIYRSLTKGEHTPVPLNTVPLSNAHFRDTFFPDRRVYYTVRALTENLDEGPPSEELTVDPAGFLPPAPVELRCFLKSSGIYLYWSEPDSSLVKGFRVYRRFESGKYELVGETQIPFFLDTAAPSRKRDYRVAAKGLSVEGPPTEMRGACASSE
jgi:hypothetical protein